VSLVCVEDVSRFKNIFWHAGCKQKFFCKCIPFWFNHRHLMSEIFIGGIRKQINRRQEELSIMLTLIPIYYLFFQILYFWLYIWIEPTSTVYTFVYKMINITYTTLHSHRFGLYMYCISVAILKFLVETN